MHLSQTTIRNPFNHARQLLTNSMEIFKNLKKIRKEKFEIILIISFINLKVLQVTVYMNFGPPVTFPTTSILPFNLCRLNKSVNITQEKIISLDKIIAL